MRLRNSIAARLVVVIMLCSTAIYALTLSYNFYESRKALQREVETNSRHLAMSLVNLVDAHLAAVAKVTEGLARTVETTDPGEPQLLALLRGTVESNPEIVGSAAAFEPFAFDGRREYFAPYYYRGEGGVLAMSRLDETYVGTPYVQSDWYQIPRELQQPEWSEPYYDEGGGNMLMTTCSVPLYATRDGRRELRGIVTADVSLAELTAVIGSVKILEHGYAALLSRNGMILAHKLGDLIMNDTFFSIAEARNDPAMREIGRRMIRGESGFVLYKAIAGFDSYMYYAPIPRAGWTLAVVFPKDELLAGTVNLLAKTALFGFAGLGLLMLAVINVVRSMTGPLRRLTRAADHLAQGDFDQALPPARYQDEVGVLTHGFESMRTSLKEYIRNLTETTAAKERIQSELKVATDIQASLLPRVFPPFPERSEIDIFASMDPAKEVGGDFYDFFFLDDDNLCFLVADVADKGVPAALYMMVAKTLLKSEGQRLREPDAMLTSVNHILAADNERCMFATVFCAILDVRTGQLRYANAGHNPPVILESTGLRFLAMKAELMLGPVSETEYHTAGLRLQPGDTIFLYTDGVTEARDPRDRPYGEQALREALRKMADQDPATLIHFVRDDLRRHAAGAPQSDDVTMLALKFRGPAHGPGSTS
jgi:sigma-B regulation protein RsbU (phosphoserine phosphatase)